MLAKILVIVGLFLIWYGFVRGVMVTFPGIPDPVIVVAGFAFGWNISRIADNILGRK